MSMKFLIVGLAAPLLSTAPAMAQTPAPADAPVSSVAAKSLDDQIAAYLNSSPEALPASRSEAGLSAPSTAPPDRAVHGEAGFGIGSNGYREAYGVMAVPIGKSGTAVVAVSQMQGRGRFGPRGRESLSIAGSLDESGALADPALGCNTGRTTGAFEPLWARRLRAERPGDALACPLR